MCFVRKMCHICIMKKVKCSRINEVPASLLSSCKWWTHRDSIFHHILSSVPVTGCYSGCRISVQEACHDQNWLCLISVPCMLHASWILSSHVVFTIMIFCEDKPVRCSYLHDGFSSLGNTMRDTIFQQFTCLHTVLHAWRTAHFLSLVTDLYRGVQCTEIWSQCCSS